MVQREVPGATVQHHDGIDGVWQAVEAGDYGVVPIENSSGGIVWSHLDRLRDAAVRIVAEANVPVHIHAAGVPGSDLSGVKKVYSHQKGLDQCGRFLQRIGEVKQYAVDSTAAAAEVVAMAKDPSSIALSSRSAIDALGLEMLAEDVADLPPDENITQLLLLHHNPENHLPFPEARRHAALITPNERTGVLADILQLIKLARVNLTSLHSRNVGRKRYTFYVEMARQGSPEEFDLMARMLKTTPDVSDVKWIGSWNKSYEP